MAQGKRLWVEFEADDALAVGAALAAPDERVERVIICTPDKDLAQCVVGTRIVQLNRRTRVMCEARVGSGLSGAGGRCGGWVSGFARVGREIDGRGFKEIRAYRGNSTRFGGMAVNGKEEFERVQKSLTVGHGLMHTRTEHVQR
jgi:hypothetical protein